MTKTFFSLIFLLLTLQLTAQQTKSNYNSLWNKVDGLIKKSGLTKTALEEVNKIYDLAKKENNSAQQIKALVYRGNLTAENTENNIEKNIEALSKELAVSKDPVSSLLHSLIAKDYWNFLQQNRWKLYDRTQTSPKNKGTLEEWTAADIHAVITKHFLASLENKKLLAGTGLL